MADENVQLDNILEELRDHSKLLESMNRSLGGASGGLTRTLNDTTKNMARLGRSADGLAESQFTANKEVGKTTDKLKDLGKASATAAANMTKQWSATTDDLSAMKPVLRGVGTAAGATGKALGTAAQAVGSVVSAFGPVGMVIGGLIGGLGSMTKAMSETTAKLAADSAEFLLERLSGVSKAYTQASQVGLTGAEGMKGLADQAIKAGVSLEQWAAISTKGAADLGFTFASATQGAKILADTAEEFRDAGFTDMFRRMGMTLEEQNESIISYAKIHSWNTRQEKLSTRELAERSANYAKELDTLAKITGESRQQIAKTLEAQKAELGWGATMELMNDRVAGSGDKLAQAMRVFDSISGDTNISTAIKDLASGKMVTEQAKALQTLTGSQAGELVEMFKTGNMSQAELLGGIQKAMQNARTILGDNEFESKMGTLGTSLTSMLVPMRRLAAVKDLGKSIEDASKSTEDQAETSDELTNGITKAQKAIQAMTNAIDKQIVGILPKAGNAIEHFATTTSNAVTGMITFMKEKLGIDIGGATTAGAAAPVSKAAASSAAWNKAQAARNESAGAALSSGAAPGAAAATAMAGGASGKMKPLLDLISSGESKTHGYNALTYKKGANGKTQPGGAADLTNMSIQDVYSFQKQMLGQGHASTAVGRYQTKSSTLQMAVNALGLDPSTTKFTPEIQDKIGEWLIMNRFKQAGGDKAEFMRRLSMEWAALKTSGGASYYEGVAGNKGGIGQDKLSAAISQSGFANGGISSGPTSGYTQLLHGTEAIVPLPDGQSIPVHMSGPSMQYGGLGYPKVELADTSAPISVHMPEMQQLNAMMTEQMSAMQSQIGKLTEVVDILRRSNSVNEKILQQARQ
jgi:hypothetical protein